MLKYRKIQIDRNKSFGKELSNFLNESFLRWRKDRTISTERVANNESIESGLAKIFLLPMITTRHRNILLNEGGKILKFLSKNYQSELISKSIHKVFEIFLCEKQLIFLFEPLHDCRTLLDLFRTVSNVDTDHNENDGIGNDLLQAETRPNQNHITLWSIQLIEVLIFLHNNAISHRYIRPEFVYIENYQPNLPRITNDLNDLKDFKQNHLKLGHFDMACFVWNPNERVTTLRHYGLQDELLENWNHLPPECFQEKYDSLLIDVWSFGTLLLYCLWQNNPFLVPHNEEQAKNNWIEYRSKHIQNQSNSKQLLSILDLIFVESINRIRLNELRTKLMNLWFKNRTRSRSSKSKSSPKFLIRPSAATKQSESPSATKPNGGNKIFKVKPTKTTGPLSTFRSRNDQTSPSDQQTKSNQSVLSDRISDLKSKRRKKSMPKTSLSSRVKKTIPIKITTMKTKTATIMTSSSRRKATK